MTTGHLIWPALNCIKHLFHVASTILTELPQAQHFSLNQAISENKRLKEQTIHCIGRKIAVTKAKLSERERESMLSPRGSDEITGTSIGTKLSFGSIFARS
ncbi:hypothetical protein Ancab_007128 [Ancistrocladus abbreviatus]